MQKVEVTRYNLGVDFASKKFDVKLAVSFSNNNRKIISSRKFENNPKGFKEFDGWIQQKCKEKNIEVRVSGEATGVYHERCCYYLHDKGYYVTIAVPIRVKRYKESCGYKSKDDNIDATALAYMGLEKNLDKWEPMNSFYYDLRSLTRHYQSVQEMETVLRNQLHAEQSGMFASKAVIQQIKAGIKLFSSQTEALKRAIEAKIATEPEVKDKVSGITDNLKGVAVLTIATVIGETNGFSFFSNRRQVTSYAGYDVVRDQSGKREGKTKISKKGNSHIRRALYFPAINVVKSKMKPFANKYDRIYEKTKVKMKGYTAIQKDLLMMIYTIWKNNNRYDPNYNENQQKVLKLISGDYEAVPSFG
jgi:transposase